MDHADGLRLVFGVLFRKSVEAASGKAESRGLA